MKENIDLEGLGALVQWRTHRSSDLSVDELLDLQQTQLQELME